MERHLFGVDVGATHLRIARVAFPAGAAPLPTGELLHRSWRGSEDLPDPVALSRAIAAGLAALGAGDPRASEGCVGIGIAAQLSTDGRMVRNAPNIGWRDVELSLIVESELGHGPWTLTVINDLHAILYGEMQAGAARGVEHALACWLGTGVGGAIAIGGRVIRGAAGTAGEIGHCKVSGSGELCGCGQRGCVEAVAGGGALERRIAAAVTAGEAAHLARPGEPLRASDVDRAAANGDPWATALWDSVASALGTVIGSACTLLSPELLLLGGGLLDRAPELARRVESAAWGATVEVARTHLRVARSALGEWAGPVGAAAWAGRR